MTISVWPWLYYHSCMTIAVRPSLYDHRGMTIDLRSMYENFFYAALSSLQARIIFNKFVLGALYIVLFLSFSLCCGWTRSRTAFMSDLNLVHFLLLIFKQQQVLYQGVSSFAHSKVPLSCSEVVVDVRVWALLASIKRVYIYIYI